MKGRGTEGRSSPAPPGIPPSLPGPGTVGYTLPPARLFNEDILFCIDIGPETMVEMKVAAGPNGRPFTRLESIKQAILLFINAKLTINPDHRFASAALTKTFSWLRKEFSSEVDSATAALRGITVDSSSSHADLTQLLRVAAHEAKKSRAQSRIFRVVSDQLTIAHSLHNPITLHQRVYLFIYYYFLNNFVFLCCFGMTKLLLFCC
ncbi:uncharacterized protein LOC111385260 [Olea europaea var. sylvestris]|uniref:uncharacterized protein LOC111385260 n=1 Tax=Olea europaea var. sylvestris TaxID=158386 RepID=UPI000C1D7CA8|nr:uncharacterized protein LOC111385260 [Olea europaea var. sylvestris]